MTPRITAAEYRTILVPLDGSPLAESVLPFAADLAKAMGSHLVAVRVHEPPKMAMTSAYEWNREVAQRELDYLAIAAGQAERTAGICPETKLLTGPAGDAIRRSAACHEKTLIVMSSHGRTGFSRFWLGSVADGIVRSSRTPVLIVRAGADASVAAPGQLERVLVPLDGSPAAETILPHAMRLCDALGASLELIRVLRPDEIPQVSPAVQGDATQAAICEAERSLRVVAERLCGELPRAVVVRVHESAAAAITDHASANGIEVIALTTTGSGLGRFVGSVADKIIRDGPPVILLLRAPEPDVPAFSGQRLR